MNVGCLTQVTLVKALADANFVRQTAIQRLTIPHALVGRNIVGLAKVVLFGRSFPPVNSLRADWFGQNARVPDPAGGKAVSRAVDAHGW
jgi:hypothetical protein